MSKTKKVLLGSMLGLATLSLASCGGNSTRNTTTPTYTNYDADAVVATSGDYSMKSDVFYNRLRYKGYDLFTSHFKKDLYNNEYNAVKQLLAKSYSEVDGDTRKNLSWTSDPITEENYNKLQKEYRKTINNSLATTIFSSTSATTVASKDSKEKETLLAKYKDTTSRRGNLTTLTMDDVKLNTVDDTISFYIEDSTKCKINSSELDELIIAQAENLYSRKKLNEVATQEIIKNDDDEEVKNNYYIFESETNQDFIDSGYDSTFYKNAYDATFKTYGNYKAIIIQFNSRYEAELTMKKLDDAQGALTEENKDTYYKALYESYYSYRSTDVSEEESQWNYTISEDKNDLSSLPSSISALVTSTLKDGQYLTEPRNLDNKYVMAYRISTEYAYPAGDTNEEKGYNDLTKEQKAAIIPSLQYNLLKNTSSSYSSTALNNYLKQLKADNKFQIYDPYFEYKFQYTYTDYYDLINNKDFKNGLIYSLDGKEYTVDTFYQEAKAKYGAQVLTDYFQLEYAHTYTVDKELKDDDAYTANEKTLNDAISAFQSNSNTTYPSEIGLETFLLGTYGYTTKENVLNYSYNYSTELTNYKAKVLFDTWSKENEDKSSDKKYVMSDEAVDLFTTLLNTASDKYSELFSMNVDHILINIDDDGDGSPDDPETFLQKPGVDRTAFEAAVVKLAQELYAEAIFIYDQYKDNSFYKILNYVKEQYNEGADILNPNKSYKSWEEFKTSKYNYNFLLTVEQLASSGDITQTSVSNFVEPFKDYLIGMQKDAKDRYSEDFKSNKLEYKQGSFYLYNTADSTQSGTITTDADKSKISTDTLCKTVYGYHLIVMNSVSKPDNFQFDVSDDTTKVKQAVELLIDEKTKNDDSDNVLVYASAWSDEDDKEYTKATIEQLFIYYVQSKNGSTTSFTDTIKTLLSSIYDSVFTQFNSSTFNTFLLIDTLNIQSNDEQLKNALAVEMTYYKNTILEYDETSQFNNWVNNKETLDIFKKAR